MNNKFSATTRVDITALVKALAENVFILEDNNQLTKLISILTAALQRERLVAFEESCKAICRACKKGRKVVRVGETWHHIPIKDEDTYPCDAARIRSIYETPTPKEGDSE